MLTTDIDLIKNCKQVLSDFFSESIDTYIDIFFHEKPTKLDNNKAKILEKAGILRKNKDKYITNVFAFPFAGKFIITDFLFSIYRKKGNTFTRRVDDVWPMYPFETLAFVKGLRDDLNNPAIKNKLCLDLASGSGTIGLFLAEKFEKIISADINPKAVQYANFNAILNNLENKIVNVQSNVFNDLKKYKFDYIVWNGPTGAFPEVKNPEKYYPQYIYGGNDGTKFTQKFLDHVFNFVTKYFKVKFLDCSLGNSEESITESYIRSKFSNLHVEVKIEFLNKNGGQLLKGYQKLYDKYCLDKLPMELKFDNTYKKAAQEWKKDLEYRKLTHVYFSYISIFPSDKFKITHVYPERSSFLPKHNFGFEWHYASKKFIKEFLLDNQ